MCPPGYVDSSCSVQIDCKYWDEERGVWSRDGLTTVISPDGTSVSCETTHLTSFGGIIEIPTSVDELLAELEAAFAFNMFSLDEAMSVLANFNFADNLTIMMVVFGLLGGDLLSLLVLGYYRGRRARMRREREEVMYESEAKAHELKQLNVKLHSYQKGVADQVKKQIEQQRAAMMAVTKQKGVVKALAMTRKAGKVVVRSGTRALMGGVKAAPTEKAKLRRQQTAAISISAPRIVPQNEAAPAALIAAPPATPPPSPPESAAEPAPDVAAPDVAAPPESLAAAPTSSALSAAAGLLGGKKAVQVAPAPEAGSSSDGAPAADAPPAKKTFKLQGKLGQVQSQIRFAAQAEEAQMTTKIAAATAAGEGWFWGDKKGVLGRKKHGPFSKEELMALHKDDDSPVDDETLVWSPTLESGWKMYGEVDELNEKPIFLIRVAIRVKDEVFGFGERFVPTLRSEHTVVNLLAPPDDEESLTQAQVVQMFWTVLVAELFISVLMYGPEEVGEEVKNARVAPSELNKRNKAAAALSEDGEGFVSVSTFAIAPVTAVTNGVVAAGSVIIVAMVIGYVFRLGNSRQRSPPDEGIIPYCKRVCAYIRRRIKRVRTMGCNKQALCEPDPEDEKEAEEEEEPPEGFIFIETKHLTTMGWVCLVAGCFACGCCNLIALVYCRAKRKTLVPVDDPRAVSYMEHKAAEEDKERRKQEALERAAQEEIDRKKAARKRATAFAAAAKVARAETPKAADEGAGIGATEPGDDPGAGIVQSRIGPAIGTDAAVAPVPAAVAKASNMFLIAPPEVPSEPAALEPAATTPVEPGPAEATEAAAATAAPGPPSAVTRTFPVTLSRQPGEAFGLGLDFDDATGDIVTLLTLDSVAASCKDLKVGDRVVEINGTRVSARSDFGALLPASTLRISLLIQRTEVPTPSPPASPPEGVPAVAPVAPPGALARQATNAAILTSPRAMMAFRKRAKADEAREEAAMINRARNLGDVDDKNAGKEARAMIAMRRLERLEEKRILKQEMREKKAEEVRNGEIEPSKGNALSRLRLAGPQAGGITPKAVAKMDLATIAIQAQLREKRKELRWRPKWEYYLRLTCAWLFDFALIGVLMLYSVIQSALFGNNQTTVMVAGWLTAYGITFAIVEPVQVIVLAGAPCLFDEETRLGRCCVRARTIYNELCAP